MVYKSGSHDELCNSVLTNQEKNVIYIHFICSPQLKFFFTLLSNHKMFVESPYLVYNTYTFLILILSFSTLQIDLCYVSFLNVPYFPGFLFTSKKNSRISTNPVTIILLLLLFCCSFFSVPTFSRKN